MAPNRRNQRRNQRQGPYQKPKRYIVPWDDVRAHPTFDPNDVITAKDRRGNWQMVKYNGRKIEPVIIKDEELEREIKEEEVDHEIKQEED
ncbi:hypothetical protein ACEPAF_401 [Sanghuangporus sanghuang]